jgi:hypothetical protein
VNWTPVCVLLQQETLLLSLFVLSWPSAVSDVIGSPTVSGQSLCIVLTFCGIFDEKDHPSQ